jgi:Domain of unknown function (DUF4349)
VNDTGLSDETLEAWFSATALSYEVPSGAAARVVAAAGETSVPRARRVHHPRLVAAGLLLVAAVGGSAIWAGAGGGSSPVAGSAPALRNTTVKDLCSGCHGANGGGATDSLGAVPAAPPAGTVRVPAAAAPGTLSPVKGLGVTTFGAAGTDGAKIVHTGSLTLQVAKGRVTDVLTRLTDLATGDGGYVSSTTTAEAGSKPSGTVVLRVPAAVFDTVLAQSRALGTVIATTSAGTDVTAEAADQQARMTALKATRDQFLTVLAKAKTIGETLAVQQRVDDTQTQIDQLQGQINVLADQASYGTLTVTVTQHVAAALVAKPVHRQSGLSKAWHSALTGFVTGVEALIARSGRALVVLLVLLVGAVALRVAWRVGRRRLV